MSRYVTVTIAGSITGTLSKDDLLAQVISALGQDNGPNVVASSIEAPDSTLNAATFGWLSYQYRAVLTVIPPMDDLGLGVPWTDDETVSAISDAFDQVAGNAPTSALATDTDTVPTVAAPDSMLPSIGGALASIENGIHGYVVIVVAVIVLAIVAIGWGKNIKIVGAV